MLWTIFLRIHWHILNQHIWCAGLITLLVIQPSILKGVHLSSLAVLPVVNIFRPKKHGENILRLRFTRLLPFCECFEISKLNKNYLEPLCLDH